jgi:hypothetical protein
LPYLSCLLSCLPTIWLPPEAPHQLAHHLTAAKAFPPGGSPSAAAKASACWLTV